MDVIVFGLRPHTITANIVVGLDEYLPNTNGGLKDIDINCKLCSLKFSWIARLLDKSNFQPWKVIANEILRPVGGCDIFHTNLSLSSETRKEIQNLPSYYKDLIEVLMREVTLQLTGLSVLHFERPIQQASHFSTLECSEENSPNFLIIFKSLLIDSLFLTKNVVSSANADSLISISLIFSVVYQNVYYCFYENFPGARPRMVDLGHRLTCGVLSIEKLTDSSKSARLSSTKLSKLLSQY